MFSIKLESINKKFDNYSNPADRFKEFFISPSTLNTFWALQNIDLEIKKGSTIALLGPNGSGKSTLLQIIAGILHPSSGKRLVNGRISALLELGAGFNPDFTGEENVYMSASILGMQKEEVKAKFDYIKQFSGIGDFIYQPVKTYSSGMFVRLAFATAINVDPDIVIIDEALAVGDAAFQQRCMNKLKQIQKQGKTIIFVSHDTSAVKSLCDEAILMDHGQIIDRGSPELIVNKYLELVYKDSLSDLPDVEKVSLKDADKHELGIVRTVPNIDNRYGSGRARILGVSLCDLDGKEIQYLDSGQALNVKISIQFHDKLRDPIVGFVLRDRLGNDITTMNTLLEGFKLEEAGNGDVYTILFTVHTSELASGHYSISPAVADGTLSNHDMCDWIDNAVTFEILTNRIVYGMMRFMSEVKYSKIEGEKNEIYR